MKIPMTLQRILPFAVLTAVSFAALADEDAGDGVVPDGFVRWNSEYIEAVADSLEQRLGDQLLVWETVGNYDGHSIYLVLRGRTDRPEMHETESDVQIGVRGTALSVVGGKLVDPVSLPRKQHRGSLIVGGLRKKTSPGDLIHIPPGVPHQLIIEPGESYMYLLFKLDEEPLQ